MYNKIQINGRISNAFLFTSYFSEATEDLSPASGDMVPPLPPRYPESSQQKADVPPVVPPRLRPIPEGKRYVFSRQSFEYWTQLLGVRLLKNISSYVKLGIHEHQLYTDNVSTCWRLRSKDCKYLRIVLLMNFNP